MEILRDGVEKNQGQKDNFVGSKHGPEGGRNTMYRRAKNAAIADYFRRSEMGISRNMRE